MKKTFILFFLSFSFNLIKAGDSTTVTLNSKEKDKLKYALNQDGSHYFQVTFLNQTWLRANESNPGTLMDGVPRNETFDIGLRRTRIQMFGQLSDQVFVYFQFGQNNFNAAFNASNNGNRKTAAFIHDALCEFKPVRGNQLKLGAGLTICNGLSRFSQPSIGSIMTMDVPVLAQATVDQTDQFSRKLSIYARGQIGHLDYRFVLSDPFPITSNGSGMPKPSQFSSFSALGRSKQLQTYLIWQFLEHENHTTPYMTGTYLGKKKIFNLAGGIIYQKNAMWNRATSNDSIAFEDMQLFCIESFLDIPLNKSKGNALSAYAGYFNTNYGKNYLRYNGLMNPAHASDPNVKNTLSGQGPTFGNSHPMFGSGSVLYSQIGYLLPEKILNGRGQLLPYMACTYASYQRLDGHPMILYNAGINWLINGHQSKISFDWQNRPTYLIENNSVVEGTRKNSFIIQYQISI